MRKTMELRNKKAKESIGEVDCLVSAAALFLEGSYVVSGTEERLL
jgi:hypothetical protein